MLFFIRSRHEICNITVYQPEHPQLVLRIVNNDYLKNHKSINKMRLFVLGSTNNYINIISTAPNVKYVYMSILLSKCNNKAVELRTALSTAYLDTSLFAYTLTGTPGYSIRLRGEAAQLFRCTPVPTRPRNTGECYQELPVTVNGRPMYLKPRTRVVTAEATETDCDPLTSAMYSIKNQWYVLTPALKESGQIPERIQPESLPWKSDSSDNDKDVTEGKTQALQQEEITRVFTTSKTFAIITFVCIAIGIILTLIRMSRKRKVQKHNSPRVVDKISVDTMTSCSHSSHIEMSATASIRQDRNDEEEMPSERYHTGYRKWDVTAEISKLKTAYSILERKIDGFTPSMRAGIHQAHGRNASPCSQLNEGGVTYGASS